MVGKVRLRNFLLSVSILIALSSSQVTAQFMSLHRSFDSCLSAQIPCGGHIKSSCQSYCSSVGFNTGTCDGVCCICSNSMPTVHVISNELDGSINPDVMSMDNPFFDFNPTMQTMKPYVTTPKPPVYPSYVPTSKPVDKRNVLPQKDVCTSAECQAESNRVKWMMNEGVDPCDDFYEFACGGFKQKTTIPQDATEVTHFTAVQDKVTSQLKKLMEEPVSNRDPKPFVLVKNLYRSCMNTGVLEKLGFSPILKMLEDLGGWPVLLGRAWQPLPEHTWENYSAWFQELGLPMDYFMRISVEKDLQSNKRHITIGQPVLGLIEQVLLEGMKDKRVNAYYNYMVDIATHMGANRVTAQQEMMNAVNFEIQLAQCFKGQDTRQVRIQNPMTIEQLSRIYPSTPWLSLFQRIFPVPISSQEVIMMPMQTSMNCFLNLVTQTDKRTIANYGIGRAIAASVPYLHGSAHALQQNFMAQLTGQKVHPKRWATCATMVSHNLGNAVGAMYVRRHFTESSKTRALEMVQNIQQAFLNILNEANWMDYQTKQQALDKAKSMYVHIGYPDEHKSDAKITELYAMYDFKQDDYFGNNRSLLVGASKKHFSDLHAPPTKKNDWTLHGKNAVANAFYLPLENAIQFPAAILQGQFFGANRSNYLNYASIGWVIGHEITHGFDDQGHQFDKNGNFRDWWNPTTKDTYNSKKQCIINQYSAFESPLTGMRVNGQQTVGESIADNGGIKQAYRGYQNWLQRQHQKEKPLPGLSYTTNQLFWIAAAQNWCGVQRKEIAAHHMLVDSHPPGEFRVRGAFANSNEFAKDFQCPVGKAMNPPQRQKCTVW